MNVVEERDLEPATESCPLCGAAQRGPPGLVLQEHPRVTLTTCRHCRGSSATRFPTPEFLARLYDPAHYTSDLLAQRRLTARFGRHLAALVPGDRDRPLRVLDYGGNDGGLSLALRDALRMRGHAGDLSFTVVDLHPRPARGPVQFETVDRFRARPGDYDVVLASAVLEHLPDFAVVVRDLLRACTRGGLLYVRTPFERWLHRVVPGYRIRWPRHLHDLGPAFWGRFLDVFGAQGQLQRSRPSPVESELRTSPARTVLAHLLKAPAHLEARLRAPHHAARWPFVGGWEAVFRIESPP